MAKRKKFHGFSYESGSMADVAIVGGTQIAKGLGKFGALVKRKAAGRLLPQDLQRLKTLIEEFHPARKFDREIRFQDELYRYLLGKLGEGVTIEKQRGRSGLTSWWARERWKSRARRRTRAGDDRGQDCPVSTWFLRHRVRPVRRPGRDALGRGSEGNPGSHDRGHPHSMRPRFEPML